MKRRWDTSEARFSTRWGRVALALTVTAMIAAVALIVIGLVRILGA